VTSAIVEKTIRLINKSAAGRKTKKLQERDGTVVNLLGG
jgi:hypothetical protein